MVIIMNEDLAQLDAELRGLFMENKLDEIKDLLKEQQNDAVKEISEYSWNVVKKYYETERFDLLFGHFTFVAYSCFLVEYAHREGIIRDEAFGIMMSIYNDLYELKKQQR